MRANNLIQGIKAGAMGTLLGGLAWSGLATAQNISDVPLFITQSVAPNILFVIDDSGSMQWETMDDDITYFFGGDLNNDAVMWTFPRVRNLHGGSPQYANQRTVPFSGVEAAYFRASSNNTVYYNPAVTYKPWSRADGSLYPDADPENAPNRPLFSQFGTRDLTSDNRQRTNWIDIDYNDNDVVQTRTFFPAVYYHYDGEGSRTAFSSYTRQVIKPGYAPFTGHGRAARSDCQNGSCTYNEEIQNFANWYSYHRNRIFASRAGIGAAFSAQDDGIRVGYGTINKGRTSVDGVSTSTVVNGVRSFDGDPREEFFEALYERDVPAAATPLRRALQGAGEYFSRSDSRGPWSSTPGSRGGEDLACRQNFTVLMTDGSWNGGNASGIGNEDGNNGPLHMTPSGNQGRYEAGAPFEDSRSDTLADVAMAYWKNDLRSDLENIKPSSERDASFWQNMVTYGVGLAVQGSINPEAARLAVKNQTAIDWPNPIPESNSTAKIDDLLHASINSRGGFFAASDAENFATELGSTLTQLVDRATASISSVATNSTRLSTDSQIYQARFNAANWTGELLAFNVNNDGSLGNQAWNAAEEIPAPDSRNILTTDTSGNAVQFEWNDISESQRSELGNEAVLDWLRGDRSNESFRDTGLLGDIVNSDPAYSGNADFGFRQGGDSLATSYASFLQNRSVTPTIYVGANDGMLHAFSANDGEELFAYVPTSIYDGLSALPQPDYEHRYYVDGSPKVFDAFVNGSWRTILIGTTGAGSSGIFALDVTDPTTFGTGDVLWDVDKNTAGLEDLGRSIPNATVARFNDGNFWAIFANGYGTDKAVLYMRNLTTGAIETFDTGADASGNGLSSPIPVDEDGDRIVDRIYAGDLEGNLWRFDFTDNKSQWGFSKEFRKGKSAIPLFTTEDASDRMQPITGRPEVGRHPDGGLMVYFGTGTFHREGDNQVSGSDARQSFYGIRDQGTPVNGRSALLEQEIIYEGTSGFSGGSGGGTQESRVRVVSENEDASKTGGFYLDLIHDGNFEGERVVSGAQLRFGRIVFTTLIPSTSACSFGGESWIMELDAFSGGNFGESIFDLNDDNNFNEDDYVTVDGEAKPVSGLASEVGIIKKPTIVTAGDVEYKYTSGSGGDVGVVKEISGSDLLGRQSWRQLR